MNKNKITVFGGSQLRPNLHIQDYFDAVEMFLEAPAEKIQGEIFNVGYQNLSLMEIAELVRKVVLEEFPERSDLEIVTTPSDDMRSYHINSGKVARLWAFSRDTRLRTRCANSASHSETVACRTVSTTTSISTSNGCRG